MKVKAVLFDLGGTLVRVLEIPHVLRNILEQRGIVRSLEEITEAWNEAEKQLDRQHLPKLLDEFWVQWNMRILGNLKVSVNIRTLAEYIATHWWDFAEVASYPDAKRILPLLKERGLKVGLISNGLQSDIDQILPKAGLQNVFDAVVVIDTLRRMKPDPTVFHHATQILNTKPSEAIFIGDEIEADYKGAEGSGLRAYLIDRNGRCQDETMNRISSLDDLLRLNIIH